MENTYKLTEAGFEQLKAELEELKGEKRNANLEALKEARAQGDLSENADYDAARDEQARIEARIKEIENILKNSEIIKENNRSRVIGMGKTVEVKFLDTDRIMEFTIVGRLEANPMQKKVSNESPLGKAIIGAKKGKVLTFKSETGQEVTVEILEVK
ncbi:MAG: transcription elongation factor GreA [Candidatus Izemoplasmatales bacterium]|jgi:transcription elongation factor GreA|nr:transcription elongation factor GreA [Candidatus Izemoplasmatales bacterium]HPD99745.1 transcription elongation factor GreA [Bacillota bacterium]